MAVKTLVRTAIILIIYAWIIIVTCNNCNTVFRNTPTFKNCTYRCHCKNDVQCNEATGDCDNDCEFGWMGPGCQYRNIARNYSSTANMGPATNVDESGAKAVDGDVNSCSKTDNKTWNGHHYWRIKLERMNRIVGLVVKIHSDDVDDFNKFRVETGSGPNNADFNSVCYTYGDTPGTTEMEIMCTKPVWTQHLRIIHDKRNVKMRVCEVEIYGGRVVTFNKVTNQSSTKSNRSSWLSVDGQAHVSEVEAKDTCSSTEEQTNPYWLVDFQTFYVVQSVYFYGGLPPLHPEYKQFKIFLLNDSSVETEIYNDKGLTANEYQPMVIEQDNQITARYLNISRPVSANVLAICEVIAFAECPTNKCGWDCMSDCYCAAETTGKYQMDGVCPHGCSGRWTGKDQKCNIECNTTTWGDLCQNTCGHCTNCTVVTGHCEDGCNGPWYPPDCEKECNDTAYGTNCSQTCGHCKNNERCDMAVGNCINGCMPGWQPPFCQTVCPVGRYGENCIEDCGHCNGSSACDASTGVCEDGCSPGYLTSFCNTTCEFGSYGVNCTEKCGHCKNGTTCDVTNGECREGCEPGWKADVCQNACENGTYGENCSSLCGNCSGGRMCNHTTGFCANGCVEGFKGGRCDQDCTPGEFGANCSQRCGHCDQPEECNKTSGLCYDKCLPGWEGVYCNSSCPGGYYGLECNYSCGDCRFGEFCNHETGACRSCENGYRGDTCNETCENGTYGERCTMNCGNCTDGRTCNRTTGFCTNGCAAGFNGERCDQECIPGEFGANCSQTCGHCGHPEECDKTSGLCYDKCLPGWEGVYCNSSCEFGSYGMNCTELCGNCKNGTTCEATNGECRHGCEPGWMAVACKDVEQMDHPPAPGHAVTIAVVIVTVLVAFGVVVAAAFVIRRRRNMSTKSRGSELENQIALHNTTAANENTDTRQSEDNAFKNAKIVNSYIDVSDLRDVCVSAQRDPQPFYDEFETLPCGLKKDASEARDPNYKFKNRYRNIYPYNANRVHLPMIPGNVLSTYINASYINGFDIAQKYIAAQGTSETTISDVWRMVWTKNVSTIVMLTNCVELGKLKCVKYWPDKEAEVHGDISVALEKSELFSDFITRTFLCTKVSSGENRTVIQFHYTAWPDEDVPETSLSLVQFWRAVRYSQSSQALPWLVHCSAGVGRTGTFIALDFLYDMGTSLGTVNVWDTVNTLREQRLDMVQTKEQYVYVHETAAEVLCPIGSVCQNDDFDELFQSLISDDGIATEKLKKEFEDVNIYKVESDEQDGNHYNVRQSQIADAKLNDNIGKSRDPKLMPTYLHRPKLSMNVLGRNDFINAVFVPTCRNRNKLILTQIPLEHTIVDFLRLIWEYKVSIVVLLEENMAEECSYYPMTKKSKRVDVFTTELRDEKIEEFYVLRTIGVSLKGRSKHKEFKLFQIRPWPEDKSTPIDTRSILRLISDIGRDGGSNAPIVVQCLDGAKKSGVFSTLWCLLERQKSNNEIAVAETVRMNCVRRKQIIDNFEQYKYCYAVMRDYLDSLSVYANVI